MKKTTGMLTYFEVEIDDDNQFECGVGCQYLELGYRQPRCYLFGELKQMLRHPDCVAGEKLSELK